jgi:hypothetical protein
MTSLSYTIKVSLFPSFLFAFIVRKYTVRVEERTLREYNRDHYCYQPAIIWILNFVFQKPPRIKGLALAWHYWEVIKLLRGGVYLGMWLSGSTLAWQAQGPGFNTQHCKKKRRKTYLHIQPYSEILGVSYLTYTLCSQFQKHKKN